MIEIHLVMGMVRCQVRSLYNCDILVKTRVYIYNWRLSFSIFLYIAESKLFHNLLGRVHDSNWSNSCKIYEWNMSGGRCLL